MFTGGIFPANYATQGIHRQAFGAASGRTALLDAANRLSDNILAVQERRNAQREQDNGADSFSTEDAFSFGLRGAKDDMTQFMSLFQNAGKAAAELEDGLAAYRDRLQGFDATIQEYQEMLDGTRSAPESLTAQDVGALLDAAKEARSQYAKDGAEEWNQRASAAASGNFMLQLRMATAFAEQGRLGAEPWRIDASAETLSHDIDATLNLTGELREGFQTNIDRIFQQWDKNGVGVERVELHLARMAEEKAAMSEAVKGADANPDGENALNYMRRAIEDRILAASVQVGPYAP